MRKLKMQVYLGQKFWVGSHSIYGKIVKITKKTFHVELPDGAIRKFSLFFSAVGEPKCNIAYERKDNI